MMRLKVAVAWLVVAMIISVVSTASDVPGASDRAHGVASVGGPRPEVWVAQVDGAINPATADYLIASIAAAEEGGAQALLIELDTPGGLVSSTQKIIQSMLNARVPVIVHVTPSGAWAASAGTFITLASNVAVMEPGTSIGAAHPVSASPFGNQKPPGQSEEAQEAQEAMQDVVSQKIENFLTAYVESIAAKRNRNVEWAASAVRESVAVTADEALELGVIDLIASGREGLLAAVEGRVVEVEGKEITLSLAGARFVELPMTLVQRIFSFIADPNVAFLLLLLGAAGIYVEVQAPGLLVPGILGVCSILLAGFAFQILPFSGIGLMLLFAGLALLVAELFVVSFGVLFIAGMACFLAGGLLLFERPDVSDLTLSFWNVLVPMAAAMTLVGAAVAIGIGRSMLRQPASGLDEMIGRIGRSETDLAASGAHGKIFVRGEYWNVIHAGGEAIHAGESVEVTAIDGLTLQVRPAPSNPPNTASDKASAPPASHSGPA